MVTYPQTYAVTAGATAGIASPWTTRGPAARSLDAAIPPEFDGPGGGFSPEELYALALTNCYVATFKVIAERSRLDFERMEARGTLTVDLDPEGRPWMARLDLHVLLEGPSDPAKAARVLEKTAGACLILNSVRTEKRVTYEIAPSRPAH
jgi:organic hydroperoxide reductase OsmC/OhrA